MPLLTRSGRDYAYAIARASARITDSLGRLSTDPRTRFGPPSREGLADSTALNGSHSDQTRREVRIRYFPSIAFKRQNLRALSATRNYLGRV